MPVNTPGRPTRKAPKIATSVKMSPDLLDKVKDIAEMNMRSISAQICFYVQEAVKRDAAAEDS